MQKPGGDRGVVHAQLRQEPGHFDAVVQKGVAGFSRLALVVCLGEVVGAGDECEVGPVVAGGDLDQQHLQLQMVAGLFENFVEVDGLVREWGCGGRGAGGFDHCLALFYSI